MKFCAVVFLAYLAIGADASKRKKVCKQIMGKLPDLEDLIIKKQNCCTVGTLYTLKCTLCAFQLKWVLSFTLNLHHGFLVVRRFGISVGWKLIVKIVWNICIHLLLITTQLLFWITTIFSRTQRNFLSRKSKLKQTKIKWNATKFKSTGD